MNTLCFRLIFSKPLGCLIPVAEITRAQRKPGQSTGSSAPNASTLKGLVLSALLTPAWTFADVLVDTANPSGTHVINAANGVPVVEIAPPNDNGLSHNRFSEFDVQKPGLIFNNSLVNGQSQLAGALLRNPNLQRMATAILSEVTGNKPSSLSGTLEVFGGVADLLVANPNGITLNGLTTLNSAALTLSTGQVKRSNGGLQFLVDDASGTVIIGAEGVNTEGLSYFDIVARSVQLQGMLGSDALQTDLQITAGQGTYDATTGTFTAKPGAQDSGVAIAGSAAGAMHGRYINLISSDSGAGVRQDGLILAAKDIAISASGDIQLNNATTKGQVQVSSTGTLTNTGALEADTALIKAQNVLNQKGAKLSGTNGLAIDAAKNVSNSGGQLLGKTVSVKADTLRNTDGGQILGTDIGLTAQTSFTHDGKASIVAAKNLGIDTQRFSATDGELLAGEALGVAADIYQNSATLRSKKDASLTLKNGSDLVIDKTFKGPLADGTLFLSARDVTVTDELNNAGAVEIDAKGDVKNQGVIIVGKTLGITANGKIDNGAGKLIWAAENLRLEAGTQLLNGVDSQLLAMGNMSLSAGEKVQNNVGRIEAQKSLWIDSPLLENLSQSTGGLKQTKVVEEDHYFGDSYGTFNWTQYFRTRISLPVYASDMTVKQAVIKAGGDLQLNADKPKDAAAKVRNLGGLIAATGSVQVKGDLENLGLSTSQSLVDALKNSQSMTRWTSNNGLVKDESPTYGTLYDLMERTFGGSASDQWVNSLKLVDTPEVNQLLSAVLGADWKAFSQTQLHLRWKNFKTSDKTRPYYADKQAEISAGGTFVHTDGNFTNGDGSNAGAQRPITIQVGSETVQSLDGELDAQFNAKRADAEKALKDLLGNPLFTRNQSGDTFGRIKPLFETRAKYLDQSQFLGSEYFLQKIGYDPQKTVSVLGDAYFDNQLILQSVEQRVGNFFAQTQRISGTDLAKQLLDNGAALALKEGLTLGQPLTEEQIAGLEKDVVWYENREVDGQRVLGPRVYLSPKTLAARDKDSKSAALVVADSVLIDANAVTNVNGTVRGNTDAFVYAKTDINNVSKGGAQAGFFGGKGQLVIAAEGQVNNQGGVMSGYEQTVVGGKGITSSATTGYDRNGSLVVRDNGILGIALSADQPKPQTAQEPSGTAEAEAKKLVAPDVRAIFKERLAAGPVDTSQGSSLNVISGGDIILAGAITQSDNVSLQTTGNLNLNDLHEARSAFDSVSSGGFLSSVHIQEQASSANSVGNTLNAKNLQINAGGNLNITGGEINAQNSAIEVAGNSTIAAGKDLAFHEKTTKTMQLVFGGGAGAGGYEVTGSFGSAAKIDTKLGGAFATPEGKAAVSLGGTATESTSPRGELYAGRSAASQTLASNGTGARSGANKGRGGTSGANVKVGLETVTTTDSTESTTYRNAQLNLGNGSVKVGKTLDIGGADINAGYQLSPEERAKMTPEQRKAATDAMPTLAVTAGNIKTTKFEDVEKTKHRREELFVGVTSEVHSSVVDVATQAASLAHKALGTDVVKDPNAPPNSSKTLATEDRKMDVDPALTTLAAAGMVTQMAFGELAGQSTTIGMKHTQQNSDSTTRSENINRIGGNISLTSTTGDIELNGVNLQGGKVGIKSAANLTQRAAKSSTVSHDSTQTYSAGLTTSIGISPTGAGMGVSVGADGSTDKTTTNSTSYTNGLISGTEVSIETKGDHNLIGSNIKGNQVAVKVGGNQTITSVQDTSNMDHERSNWSASVGVAITTNGLVQGTGSASGSYGEDFDRSKLVAEQAGISGDKLDLNVAGNLNLTGAHITSQKGQGNVQVGGKINAQTLQDTREKDGGYGGGGGGISKNGLASVTLEFGRVDQVHYNANNAATIDVGDASKVTAAKGVSGILNTDADNQLNVVQNKRVAGTDVKIEISPGDAQEIKAGIKGGVKKLLSRASGGGIADAPKPKSTSPADTPRATPNVYTAPPKAKPTFDQRVIVNTDPSNPAVGQSVQNLVNKNPGTTAVVTPDGKGGHTLLQGTLAGGTTKVEVVGHGDGTTLGGLDKNQITDVVKSIAKGDTTLDKLALVGCGTHCAKEGRSLVNDVKDLLLQQGIKPDVKGYETAITVNENGRKQAAQPGDPNALGNTDPDQQTDQPRALPPATDTPAPKAGGRTVRDRLLELVARAEQRQQASAAQTPTTSADEPPIESAARPAEQKTLIDQAQTRGRLTPQTAEVLRQAKEEIRSHLETGVVLLGENHNQPDTTLLMRDLIAEGSAKRLMFEMASLDNEVEDSPGYSDLRQALKKKGYASVDDYLKRSVKADGSRDANELLAPLLDMVDQLKYATYPDRPHPWKDLIKEAAVRGLKLHFIDKTYDQKNASTPAMTHSRNKFMAKQIKANPELTAPGTLGLVGGAHLKRYLKGTSMKEGLHRLANIDESRTYDLTPAFTDMDTMERYPRWNELKRGLGEPPRVSVAAPFRIDTSKKPTLLHPAPYYTAPKYKNRIVVDQANTPGSMEMATTLLGKHPENTLVFTDAANGLTYKAGTHDMELTNQSTDKKTKLSVLKTPGQSAPPKEQLTVDIERKVGHQLADLKLKVISVPEDVSTQTSGNRQSPLTPAVPAMRAYRETRDSPNRDANPVEQIQPVRQADLPATGADQPPIRAAQPDGHASSEAPPPLPHRAPVGQVNQLQNTPSPSLNAHHAMQFDTVKTKADIDALLARVAPKASQAKAANRPVGLIDRAMAKRLIGTETGSFLKQAKQEVSRRLEKGVVLLGEAHNEPEAPLLMRELMTEGKIRHVMMEMSSLTDLLLQAPGYLAVQNQLQMHGYATAEEYLNGSIKPDGSRTHSELLGPLLHTVKNIKAAGETEPHLWTHVISGAAKKGIKLHFIDKAYGDSEATTGEGVNDRNNHMAAHINNTPDLKAPGAIALLGADHIRNILKGTTVTPGVHRLANIDELQTYDLTQAFLDWETGKIFPRWNELNRSAGQPVKPRNSILPPFELDKTNSTPETAGVPRYKEAHFKARIVLDRANTPDSLQIAHTLLSKHPENTILFTQAGDSIDYRAGNGTQVLGEYAGKTTKFHLLLNDDQFVRLNRSQLNDQVREVLTRKFGFAPANVQLNIQAVESNTPAPRPPTSDTPKQSPTDTAQPLPAANANSIDGGALTGSPAPHPRKPLVALTTEHMGLAPLATAQTPSQGQTGHAFGKRLIDQAAMDGVISPERADFLEETKQEITDHLKTGPVLIGENHEAPDAPLLIRQLIEDGSATQVMLELAWITPGLKYTPGYSDVEHQLQKRGYLSAEEYLNRSIKPDGSRKDSNLLAPLLVGIEQLKMRFDRTSSWKDVIIDAAKKGIKLHFIDRAVAGTGSPSEAHSRNKHMANQIIGNPDLRGPGAVGLFGADHLALILKGSAIKPGVHGLANIDELRTYDLSPAYWDWNTGEFHPRWSELGRTAAHKLPPRRSTLTPFKLDKTSDMAAPRYVEATYKNRIIVDRVNTPASIKLTDRLLAKHPENTIVFSKAAGKVRYKAGSSTTDPEGDYLGKLTKFTLITGADGMPNMSHPAVPTLISGQIKRFITDTFGHGMGDIKLNIQPMPGSSSGT